MFNSPVSKEREAWNELTDGRCPSRLERPSDTSPKHIFAHSADEPDVAACSPGVSRGDCNPQKLFRCQGEDRILWRLFNSMAMLLAGLVVLSGCRTAPTWVPIDTAQPGWNVQQGQAVWRPSAGTPEIAGELIVATHDDQSSSVQFIKTPFPIVIAQTRTNGWEITFPTQARTFAGRGAAPERFLWLHLSGCLIWKKPPPKSWRTSFNEGNRWIFENQSTGERLEGYLGP
ncbi:MAG: hypothetical protein FJ403_20070 [Verrucomicrobia bacterium]|nr:hypothetical protein [Verrucomicrobiota bacterium]